MRVCLACDATLTGGWRCSQCGHQPETRDGLPVLAPALAGGNPEDATYRYAELLRAEKRHFWFKARLRLVLWTLRRYFPSSARLLEIGCGTGHLLAQLSRLHSRWRLAGSDAVVAALQHARARLAGVELLQMDARQMPFDREFDVVCALDVLEHVEEDEVVLSNAFRALEPGGGLVLTVPQHPSLWSALDDYSGHKRRYTRNEVLSKLDRAGFEVLRVTSFLSFLLPVLYLSRRTPRTGPLDPVRELEIAAPVNALLGAITRFEAGLIQLGVSFPAGGSLLAVARRPHA